MAPGRQVGRDDTCRVQQPFVCLTEHCVQLKIFFLNFLKPGLSLPWCSAVWCLASVAALGKNLKHTSHWISVLSCRVWLANTSGWLVLLWYHNPESCCGNKSNNSNLAGSRSLPSFVRATGLFYLVRLVAEVTAEWFGPYMCALVFIQQGSASEHLVTGGASVKLFGMELLDMLTMLLQSGKTETAFLTVVRLRHICWEKIV